jgi:microcystin-dependent protein
VFTHHLIKSTLKMEPYLAEIKSFPFNRIPVGWLPCDGQLMPKQQYVSLFSLLGTQYGGDGINTFALPDLRGRAPIHFSSYMPLGSKGGQNSVTLDNSNVPLHKHKVMVSKGTAISPVVTGNLISQLGDTLFAPYTNDSELTALILNTVGVTGGSVPVSNMQPYLGLTYCIAIVGIMPSRS